MKKFEFELDESLYNKSSIPIRNKYDLLRLLAHTIKFLVNLPATQEQHIDRDKKLILYIDKMSRLLFCTKDKISSFQFPLQVQVKADGNNLSIHFGDFIEIDNLVSSILVAIFEQTDIFEGTLENIDEKVLQVIIENEWEDIDYRSLCELIKCFVLFEPGYLRYDHDVEHANGELHPEHHLDIFFSSNNEMKIGLRNGVESDWMLDLLNILTKCRFIT